MFRILSTFTSFFRWPCFCLTHRRKVFPLLHAIQVYFIVFLTIYIFLSLSLSLSFLKPHNSARISNQDFCHPYFVVPPKLYQPIPNCSILVLTPFLLLSTLG